MISWVDELCRQWGRHKHRVQTGDQGWPERSLSARLIEEGAGAGAGHGEPGPRVPIKDPPGAYTLVSVAIQRMAATHELEQPILVLEAHYTRPGKAGTKAPELGVSVKQYWNLLHAAHAFIAGMATNERDVA